MDPSVIIPALDEASSVGQAVANVHSVSHPPTILRTLHRNRERGDMLIASRYGMGGLANMPLHRKWLSRGGSIHSANYAECATPATGSKAPVAGTH